MAVTPAAWYRVRTPFQLADSAKAPWMTTTVGWDVTFSFVCEVFGQVWPSHEDLRSRCL
jgi:hypothetical protein